MSNQVPSPSIGHAPNLESVVIKLDRPEWQAQSGSTGAGRDPSETREPIHRRQYDRFLSSVKTHLGRLDDLRAPEYVVGPDSYPSASGWTFFLDGTRGAGKSTFLRHLEEVFEKKKEEKLRMRFLPLIDPSRIEHSEIPLLVILRQIAKCVNRQLEAQGSLDCEKSRQSWREAFKNVAGGLALFQQGHHALNDLDPELFLDWGLERAGDSLDLRKKLQKLFDLACEILKVDALMLAFDDADTDAGHAVGLLECIRKYLDMPRMMVVVAGDMELYALLVRRHFAKTIGGRVIFGNANTENIAHKGRSDQYLRMIDQLEEQYLLKLFPTHRRASLAPLWNTMDESTSTYRYEFSWSNAKCDVREQIDQLIRSALRIRTKSDVALFRVYLLKQPLRSVIDLMAHCARHLEWPNCDSGRTDPGELFNTFCAAMRGLTLTSLYKLRIDTDALSERSSPELCRAVFDLTRGGDDVDTAPYLSPTSDDEDIRNCSAALAAEVARFCYGQPGAMLRYLCRGPLNVLLYVLTRDGVGYNEQSDLGRQRFRQYLGIGRDEYALDWGRRATGQIASHYSTPRSKDVQLGTYFLSSKDSAAESAAIQLSLIKISERKGIRTYASLFTLLGLVERLLSEQYNAKNDNAGKGLSIEDIRHLLRKTYPTLTIPAPSWGATAEAEARGRASSRLDTEEEADDELIEQLLIPLEEWLSDVELLKKFLAPSSIFVGKVANRLLLNLENVAEAFGPRLKQPNVAADLVEMFAVCLLNAFFVEEAEHHFVIGAQTNETGPVNRGNPRTSPKPFLKKLKATKLLPERWPLMAIVATCPLVLGLLYERAEYREMFEQLLPKGSCRNKASYDDIVTANQTRPAPVLDAENAHPSHLNEEGGSSAKPAIKAPSKPVTKAPAKKEAVTSGKKGR